jgi:hypothetical protein
MISRITRLPSRIPVGTRYVIEGRGGHISLRYLEFPDGRQFTLPAVPEERGGAGVAARGRREAPKPGSKKIPSEAGTPRRLSR